MIPVFIQIKCELGRSYETADAILAEIEYISEVHSTSGDYDLLIKCYLPDNLDIGRYVCEKLQALPGIKDTYTIITFKTF